MMIDLMQAELSLKTLSSFCRSLSAKVGRASPDEEFATLQLL